MAGRQAVKDVNAALTGYQRSLEDLTFNSKPLIDDLTRAAEQLEPKGDEVVEIIRRRIMKVASKLEKLSLISTHHFFLLLLFSFYPHLFCVCFYDD